MPVTPYFSSSARVWDAIEWVFGIEDAGYSGWEIVADGSYRLDNADTIARIDEVIQSTRLGITVHAPYGDLNLATLNDPIWRESIRQICTCIEAASAWTDRVTIHPDTFLRQERSCPAGHGTSRRRRSGLSGGWHRIALSWPASRT